MVGKLLMTAFAVDGGKFYVGPLSQRIMVNYTSTEI